jgi:hypothetical protein
MAHHTLTLNYLPDGEFRPGTALLRVKTGDTISFTLGTVPPKSTFVVTLDPKLFSPAEVKDSSTQVTVVKAALTRYQCQLCDESGKPLSWAAGGAQVEPDGK